METREVWRCKKNASSCYLDEKVKTTRLCICWFKKKWRRIYKNVYLSLS